MPGSTPRPSAPLSHPHPCNPDNKIAGGRKGRGAQPTRSSHRPAPLGEYHRDTISLCTPRHQA
eukprot:2286310-Pleurochrysis_carterae.AAC.1